jgi:hypothetical protein
MHERAPSFSNRFSTDYALRMQHALLNRALPGFVMERKLLPTPAALADASAANRRSRLITRWPRSSFSLLRQGTFRIHFQPDC